MRCKTGDVCYVIKQDSAGLNLLGRVLTIVGPCPEFQDSWVTVPKFFCRGQEVSFPDATLMPIRFPGADARDQSAAWLPPVPTLTKEPT